MKRRFDKFRKNKRGYYSLWIFLVLFILTTCAEFIANDKPIVVSYKGELYFPILTVYPEKVFGGDFETETDYRDEYIYDLITKDGWMLWPMVRYSYTTINYTIQAPSPPSAENWFGTDDQGRDVFARVIYGFRISVFFGLILTIISSIVGIIAGAVQGYFGGWTDLIFQRFIEIWSSMPQLFIIIIMTSFIAPDFWWLLGIMLLFSWMSLVGVVRAECLKTRNMDYIRAAKALGVKEHIIIFRHILPNSIVAALTFMPFILNGSITTLTVLDFLNFGLPSGSPSLGELLAQGKANLDAPWLGIAGFSVVAVMLSLLIFIGEATRDAFNPNG